MSFIGCIPNPLYAAVALVWHTSKCRAFSLALKIDKTLSSRLSTAVSASPTTSNNGGIYESNAEARHTAPTTEKIKAVSRWLTFPWKRYYDNSFYLVTFWLMFRFYLYLKLIIVYSASRKTRKVHRDEIPPPHWCNLAVHRHTLPLRHPPCDGTACTQDYRTRGRAYAHIDAFEARVEFSVLRTNQYRHSSFLWYW